MRATFFRAENTHRPLKETCPLNCEACWLVDIVNLTVNEPESLQDDTSTEHNPDGTEERDDDSCAVLPNSSHLVTFKAVSHPVYRLWVEHAFQACIAAVSSWIAL
jgi:hypothetical protein